MIYSNSNRISVIRKPLVGTDIPVDGLQYLYGVDSDGGILDRVSTLSKPVYTGNNCKKFDGVGDYCELLIPKETVAYPITIGGWFIANSSADNGTTIADPAVLNKSVGVGIAPSRQPYGVISKPPTSVTYYTAPSVVAGSLVHVQFVLISDTERHLYVNGNEVAISQASNGLPGWSSADLKYWIGGTGKSTPTYRVGTCSSQYVKFAAGDGTISYEDCYCAYNLAAGPALIEWDVSGNGRHGTYTTTSGINTMATTSNLVRPHNILDGFSLYTHATLPPLRVPYDINGDPLSSPPVPTGYTLASEHPGGRFHNGAESTVTQTDDYFVNGTANFYSADGATQDAKSYADFLAYHPFDLGLLLQWEQVSGVCLLKEAIQMPFAYTWFVEFYILNLAYIQTYTSACGASPLVPAEVTVGTGIGPALDWADAGASRVILVEDV